MLSCSKVAVVTGACGGLGASIVKELRSHGWTVIALDIRSKTGDSGAQIICDLRKFVKKTSYRDEILQKIKNLLPAQMVKFALVNNAAVQLLAPASRLSYEQWNDSLSVNLLAPFFLSQGLLEPLKAARGSVINISSIHGELTKKEFAAYAVSKGGLNTLTRSLAIEWAEFGISVNCICPAAIDTPMLRAGFNGDMDSLEGLAFFHPTKRIGRPEEVAELVYLLAEFRGKFLTGAVVDLSGGISSVLHDPS